jgi:AcrR family transcriptional regulator
VGRGRGPFAGSAEEAQRTLLRAAEQCFLDYGVRRTTMDDIARRAGVSRPTLYRYFRDRDGLVVAVIARRTRAFSGRARAYIDERPTFAAKVVDGVTLVIEAGREDPITRALLRPESLNLGEDVLTGSDVSREIAAEVWAPVFAAAQRSGEMRADLDIDEVCAWIADVETIIVGWQELLGLPDSGVRGLVERFVLPALLPA